MILRRVLFSFPAEGLRLEAKTNGGNTTRVDHHDIVIPPPPPASYRLPGSATFSRTCTLASCRAHPHFPYTGST